MARSRNKRARVGRPATVEKEITVQSMGQLLTWPIRNAKPGTHYELNNIDDLLTRKGFAIYREMMTDDQIKACLAFKKLLVTGRAWEIQPKGGKEANEEAKKISAFCETALERIDMPEVLRQTLTALDFGFSLAEINWEVVDPEELGEEAGGGPKLVPKNIKHRDPEWVKIDVDVHGNITGYRQISGFLPAVGEIILPLEKMMLYTYAGNFQNHYGQSDLRAAYVAWWSKKFVTQFYNIFLERFGQPLMMMKYPEGASEPLKQALKAILQGLSSKTDILVPEGVMIELIEATRAGTARYDEALTSLDVRISRAILVPALLGMGVDTKRGSDSQSRLHLRVLMKVVNELSNGIARAITQNVIKPMVDANFDTKMFPDFIFQDYGEYEAVEIADSIIQMFNAGILDLDQEDINYARSILGLPLRMEGDEDEVLRSQPPPIGTSPNDPNAAGAGGAQGNDRAKKGASQKKQKPGAQK